MRLYKRKENKNRCYYYASVLLIILLEATAFILFALNYKTLCDIIEYLSLLIPMIALPVSFMRTRKNMLEYHHDKFLVQKKALTIYLVFDLIGYTLWILIDILLYMNQLDLGVKHIHVNRVVPVEIGMTPQQRNQQQNQQQNPQHNP